IQAYGSMEGLLDNTHELKGKMKENIEASKELGLLSKKLATIMLDVPVTFDATDFEMSEHNIEAVTSIFQELEFRQLLTNFLKSFSAEADLASSTSATSGTSTVEKSSSSSSPKTAGT